MIPLDRPIWTALSTRHADLAVGGPRARRYQTDIEPFIASADEEPESLAEFERLIPAGEELIMIQRHPALLPSGVRLVEERAAVQMILEHPDRLLREPGAEPLGDADVPAMIALAELTRPGPFRARTHTLGQFWGIRHEGRLVAMAGERMKLPGLTELSGVCVHPEWRGHSFARNLSMWVASEILDRGETPFLHAYADNVAAIGLYERLGFVLRSEMRAVVVIRED